MCRDGDFQNLQGTPRRSGGKRRRGRGPMASGVGIDEELSCEFIMENMLFYYL